MDHPGHQEPDEDSHSVISSISASTPVPTTNADYGSLRSLRAPVTLSIDHVQNDETEDIDVGLNQEVEEATDTSYVELFKQSSISAKINGHRYLCIVKHDGSCELIASSCVPHELYAHDVLMVLDGELVSITGHGPWEDGINFAHHHDSTEKIETHLGNLFVIFDVVARDSTVAFNIPVWERLRMLELLLWNGECKFCKHSYVRHRAEDQCNDNECCFGFRLKHPWFSRAVVKRTFPLRHVIGTPIKTCLPGNSLSITSKLNRECLRPNGSHPVITSLYDGYILDAQQIPITASSNGDADEMKNSDFCYKIKPGACLTADLRLGKIHSWESFQTGRQLSLLVDSQVRLAVDEDEETMVSHFPIEFPSMDLSNLLELIHKRRYYNPTAISSDTFRKINIPSDGHLEGFDLIVECVFDTIQSRWIFIKLRSDKSICNTKSQVDKIVYLTRTNNKPWNQLQLYLNKRTSDFSQGVYKLAYRASQEVVNKFANEWLGWCKESPSISIEALFWNFSNNANSPATNVIQKLLDRQQDVIRINQERIYGIATKMIQALAYHKVLFNFHDHVKMLLYSLFDQAVVIDVGCGKLKMETEWEQMFQKVVGIEREKRHFPENDTDNDQFPLFQPRNSLVVLNGDACDPDLGESLARQLSISDDATSSLDNGTSAGTRKADCCFGMFALQSIISSRANLDAFLSNLLPNLKDDGLIVAMMLDGDEAVKQLRDYPSTDVYGPGVRITIWRDKRSWAGLVVDYKNSSYHDESAEEIAPLGLSNRQSNLNLAMRERGFELQSVLPLNMFNHLVPFHHGLCYDYAPQTSRKFTQLYKCVVWKRVVPLSTPSQVSVSSANDKISSQCPSTSPSLIQLLGGVWSKMSLDNAVLSSLIYDYFDIRSHFQLAMTNRTFLRYYIRGHNKSSSLYSLSAIMEGIHIQHSVLTRSNPLFKLHYSSDLGATFRVINPATYYWLQQIPCIDGCAACSCSLNQLKEVAKNSMNIQIASQHDPHLQESFMEPHITDSEYYPYPVDGDAMFCMCNKCFMYSYESPSCTGAFRLARKNKFFHNLPATVGMTQCALAKFHHTSRRSSFLILLVLRALFTENTGIDEYFGSSPTLNLEKVYETETEEEDKSAIDKLLEELVPELFNSRRNNVIAYLDNVRHMLDNNFFHIWQMFEYSLAVEILHRGAPYPTCMMLELKDDGDQDEYFNSRRMAFGTEIEERKSDSPSIHIPLTNDILSAAMKQAHQLIGSHATWNERWAALRFRGSKRQHGDYSQLYDDRSEGEDYTDITPFHTTRW